MAILMSDHIYTQNLNYSVKFIKLLSDKYIHHKTPLKSDMKCIIVTPNRGLFYLHYTKTILRLKFNV